MVVVVVAVVVVLLLVVLLLVVLSYLSLVPHPPPRSRSRNSDITITTKKPTMHMHNAQQLPGGTASQTTVAQRSGSTPVSSCGTCSSW